MPLLRNPAIAGIFTGDIRVQGAYRSQWSSVTVPYKTMALSSEVKFPVSSGNDYFTVALQLSNDVAGDANLRRTQILPAFNYLKSLNEGTSYISAGFIFGFVQSQFDPTKMTFDDQFQNGQFNSNNTTNQSFKKTSESYFDASAGLSYSGLIGSGTKFYIGGAYYHLNKPKVSFYNDASVLKPRTVINAGLNMPTSVFDNFYVYGDYIMQAGHRQALIGLLYGHAFGEYDEDESKTCISIGGFYRWGDAFIPVAKLEYNKICIGVSYDVNVSKLTVASQSRGGFELTLSFKSFLNIRNSTHNSIRERGSYTCPINF